LIAYKTDAHPAPALARRNCHWHREDLVAVKLHDYFAGLLDGTVNINDDRLRQLDDHVAAIRACLREDEDFALKVRRFVPQGSWAQRTIIKPLQGHEFDADVLVEMKQQRKWADDPRNPRSNGRRSAR
jgi:hypothetical protein